MSAWGGERTHALLSGLHTFRVETRDKAPEELCFFVTRL
jgi:hypothetical protein